MSRGLSIRFERFFILYTGFCKKKFDFVFMFDALFPVLF